MKPKFFDTGEAFAIWLEANHASQTELLVGFHKKQSGKPSMSWPESVDAALRFGWIDGIRRRIDEFSYSIRFTPRKSRSVWSLVNVRRVEELTVQKLMHPAGIKAFEARSPERSGIYSFEQKEVAFAPEQLHSFRANKSAWRFFSEQANWYQRTATWWVISAKREDTKGKRLAQLMEDSAAERTLRHLTRNSRK